MSPQPKDRKDLLDVNEWYHKFWESNRQPGQTFKHLEVSWRFEVTKIPLGDNDLLNAFGGVCFFRIEGEKAFVFLLLFCFAFFFGYQWVSDLLQSSRTEILRKGCQIAPTMRQKIGFVCSKLVQYLQNPSTKFKCKMCMMCTLCHNMLPLVITPNCLDHPSTVIFNISSLTQCCWKVTFQEVCNRNLGGSFKYVFFVHPYLGRWSNVTSIFFKWVGEKPPTRNVQLRSWLMSWPLRCLNAGIWTLRSDGESGPRGLETVTRFKWRMCFLLFPFNGQIPGFWGDS